MKYFQTNRGNVSVPLAIAASAVMTTVAGLASYFGTVNAQNQKVAEVRTEFKEDISFDRQKISALEEAIGTIKTDNMEMKRDLKEILRAVK